MGYIAKRGTRAKPLYYAQFKDLDGKYKMRALKGVRSQEEAARALAKIEARIADGKRAFEDRTPPSTLGVLIERWRDHLENRNAADDRSRIERYILPAYRNRTLAEGQRSAVKGASGGGPKKRRLRIFRPPAKASSALAAPPMTSEW
jgi:hypothetical protein